MNRTTIKRMTIIIVMLTLIASCFEVKAGERIVEAYGLGHTDVVLASGVVVTLIPGQSLQIDQPAKSYVFADYLDYIEGYNRQGDNHDPRAKVQLRDAYALLPRLVLAWAVARFSSRKSLKQLSVFTRGEGRKIALVDLRYPYGKKKIYLSGSLFTTAAQFWHGGWDVEVVDFNIDNHNSSRVKAVFNEAEVVGISVVGAPYLSQVVAFCKQMNNNYPDKPVLLGGQVMTAFSPEQFAKLFGGTNAVLVKSQEDLRQVDIPPESLPDALTVSLYPVLERLPEWVLRLYLSHEMPLVLSQGCRFNCHFCAAAKNRPESFKDGVAFGADLYFMARKAKEFGIGTLEFYATNLDFFQSPETLANYLHIIASIRKTTGVEIRVRGLACMSSFLLADKRIANLGELLRDAGFYCVGFGVDGPTEEIWQTEGKTQNHMSDISKVLKRTQEMGLETEILMIMGDRRYDLALLLKTIHFCYGFIVDWPHTFLRMHLNKVLPGSAEWFTNHKYVNRILSEPSYGANLDVLAMASLLTHPDRKQRWQVNLAYFTILIPLRLAKRCVSSTLLPQGGRRPFALLAWLVNPHMPYDR